MLRRLGIRAKVLAVLAVPMLVLVLLGVYISVSALDEMNEARATQSVTTTLRAYMPLGQAIDTEYIVSMTSNDPEAIKAAQAATDVALADVRKYTAKLPLDRFPTALVQQFDSVQADYETTLPAARLAVERGGVSSVVRANFQTIERGQLELVAQLAEIFPNREVAAAVTGYRTLSQTSTDLVAELIQGSSLLAGTISPALGAVYQEKVDAVELSRTSAAIALNRMPGDLTLPKGQPTSLFISQRAQLASGELESVQKVDPAAYAAEVEAQTTALVGVAEDAIQQAQVLAAADVDAATQRTYVTVAATILAFVLSLLLALVVSRSIVIPLRRLTSAASDVRERLPQIVEQVATPGEQPDVQLEPIPVNSRDEVGRLAQAFNSMNSTTVRVAQEQAALRGSIAEMFVNVARRDQVLLNRQLSFIDSLERSEEDPNTLANLFRLDHLATRMRRNAESLLVLAGIDSGRRLRDSMPLSDVIRTASSEIEQYDRIELDLQVDPHMLGFNALPAAHLLAELLENATVFSEPETPVTVTTGVSGQFVAVRIRDHGLGMTEEEIVAANAKIVSSGAGDALGAQRLGLFVVGRIAQKLGAAVRLAKAEGGTGTDTTVLLPASLFASNESTAYGAPSIAAEVAAAAAEAPEVAPVDLAALTDGETSLGLPRRRRGEGEPSADSAPIPVASSGLPTRGGGELPARPRKTFDENAIVLPETAVPTLSPDLSSSAPDWAPATLQSVSGTGLPSRAARSASPAITPAAPAAPAPDETPAIPTPAARAGLFSGFRGRSAFGDGEGSDQVRAPWMSLGAHGLPPAAGDVPALAQDDEPAWAPEDSAPTQLEVPGLVPDDEPEAAEAEPAAVSQDWAPTFVEDEAPAEHTYAEQAHAEPTYAEQHEASAAPIAYEDEAVETQTPAAEVAYEPFQAEQSAYEPEHAQPEYAQPEYARSEYAQPADAPLTYEPAGYAQAEHSYDDQPAAQDEPAAAADALAGDEQPAAYEPVGYEQPAAYEPVGYEQPAAYEPEGYEPVSFEPAPTAAIGEPLVARAAASGATADSFPQWEAPSVELAEAVAAQSDETYQPSSEQPAAFAAAPVAEAPRVVTPTPVPYTSYSGYAGWSAAGRAQAEAEQPFDFERTLDEARAWHTGAMPTVAEPAVEAPAAHEPAAYEPAAYEPAAYEPVAEAPAYEPAAFQPVAEPVSHQQVAEPVAYEPTAYEPVAEPVTHEPVAHEAVQPEQAVEPAAAWQAPVWEAPTEQLAEAVPAEPAAYEAFTVPALAEDEPAQEADPVWAETTPAWGAPAWPSIADGEQGAQSYAPPAAPQPVFEAQPAPVEPQPVAPVQPVAEQPAPAAPWGAAAGFGAAGVSELEHAASDDKGSKKRWGLFGRRKGEQAAAPAASFTPTQASAPAAPSWSSSVPVEQPAPAEPTRQSAWSAPEPPAPHAPAPVAPTPPAAGGWAPPEWAAARQPTPAATTVDVPNPVVPQSVAPRIGTLDDNVAAMLALRSDIQEQALSELSQLSSYRPSVNSSGERLTKRVPTAMPPIAPEPSEAAGQGPQRDPNELRSRLSSFQSGTSRGRQAAGDSPRSSS